MSGRGHGVTLNNKFLIDRRPRPPIPIRDFDGFRVLVLCHLVMAARGGLALR